jgi:hypothetical protein
MDHNKAIVRSHIERIDGVTRTWFEHVHKADHFERILIVEVDFNTDPNDADFRSNVLDAILDTAQTVLQEDTTMVVSGLRVVPRL